MKTPHRLLCLSICIAIMVTTGCERSAPPAPPFNTVLGDSNYGAPPAMQPTDMSLVKDLTAYVPAPLPGGNAAAAPAANPGDAEGQVRALFQSVHDAGIKGDFDKLLDAFQPEQVAALRGDDAAMSALRETYEKAVTLLGVIASKLGQTIDTNNLTEADLQKLMSAFFPEIASAMNMKDGLKFEVKDAENVIVTSALNLNTLALGGVPHPGGGLPQEATTTEPSVAVDGASGTPTSQAIPSGAAANGMPLLVAKQGGKWQIQLPMPVTEDMVKELKKGIRRYAKPLLDKLIEKVDAMESADPAALKQVLTMTAMTTIAELSVAEDEEEEGGDFVPAPSSGSDSSAPTGEGDTQPPPSEPPSQPPGGDSPRNPRRPGGGG